MNISYELNKEGNSRTKESDLELSLQEDDYFSEIRKRIQELYEKGKINYSQASKMYEDLDNETTRYVLKNFGIVLTAGIPFAFLPPPIGSFFTSPGRFFWTLREIRKNKKKNVEKIYGLGTAILSAIPWIGPYALLLPLGKENPRLCYLAIEYYARSGVRKTANMSKKFKGFVS